jgi:Tfp pilus assembly protein PilF
LSERVLQAPTQERENDLYRTELVPGHITTVFSITICTEVSRMGNKLCCAARDGLDSSEIEQFNQDGIEVFTDASISVSNLDSGDEDMEDGSRASDGISQTKILTKSQLEKQFTTQRRKNPHDLDNLANYALFLVIIRGEKDTIRAEKILREAEKIVERDHGDGCLTYSVFALYHWLLKKDEVNAEKYFNKALQSAGNNEETRAHLLSDHALFLESLGDKNNDAVKQYINARESNIIDPVNLCNLAIITYRAEPYDFNLAAARFKIALKTVNNSAYWKSQGRGNFVRQSYNIFVAAYSVKIAAMAVHNDHEWEGTHQKLFKKHHIHTFHDFFDFDVSLRPISVVVQQNLHLHTHFVDKPKRLELIDDIVGALAKHSKEHVKDFRSRWRYAMILWHCCEDFDAASNEFKEMSEQCDPLPSYEAYVDAALFFQNHNQIDVAEKFYEKAFDAGGHANGHCVALMAIFYHDIKVDRVKAVHWAANAVHLDTTMDKFLRDRGVEF